ncbi:MAG TPA: ATP synthase F1 subunit epsilon [Feifaniaceae bacterium]|nr:ATP synthase F1 subunit epsilon [Feifaniaceae bacterium]
MPKPFRLMVLTPEREFYNGEAYSVTVNTIAGNIGVLADHIPMVTVLTVGALVIRTEDGAKTAFHSEGFMEVRADGVIVLCQACEWPEEIDEERAHQAEERARMRLSHIESELASSRSKVALLRAITRQKVQRLTNKNM